MNARLLRTSVAVLAGAGAAFAQEETVRVTVGTQGAEPDFLSSSPAVSAKSRHVAFDSAAGNLVPGDGNGLSDIFVRDMQTGVTERVSVDNGGGDPSDTSYAPAISANGRIVAFHSDASDLVDGDMNARRDVFVRDRKKGVTERVSLDLDGGDANNDSTFASISADGRQVAYTTFASDVGENDANGTLDVFVFDRKKRRTVRASVASDGRAGNGPSFNPAISGNGRFVAFQSGSDTLITGDTNGVMDVFVRDLKARRTTRVSVSSAGQAAGGGSSFNASISANGRIVAFQSEAANLVEGDTNGTADVFVHDRKTGVTTRVSVATGGGEAALGGYTPALSGDGRYVAFLSDSADLVEGDSNNVTDVFLHDRATGETRRISVGTDGGQASLGSSNPAFAPDGSSVAFESAATQLAPPDGNGWTDVFLRLLR